MQMRGSGPLFMSGPDDSPFPLHTIDWVGNVLSEWWEEEMLYSVLHTLGEGNMLLILRLRMLIHSSIGPFQW